MRIFDGHVHLADQHFQSDFDGILKRMYNADVQGCMVICDPGDPEPDHERAIEIVSNHSGFFLSVGCHPQNALHYSSDTEKVICDIASYPFGRCIGEIGLDYYENRSTKEQQIAALESQLDLACDMHLPVQLHIRNAHGDMIDVLRRRKAEGRLPKGVVHCFTRSAELAKVYLSLGFSISFAGPVTYRNANKLLETVRMIPDDRLMIETDAPWVSPELHRGEMGEPAFIVETLVCMAKLRNTDPETLADMLWQNAEKMYFPE